MYVVLIDQRFHPLVSIPPFFFFLRGPLTPCLSYTELVLRLLIVRYLPGNTPYTSLALYEVATPKAMAVCGQMRVWLKRHVLPSNKVATSRGLMCR